MQTSNPLKYCLALSWHLGILIFLCKEQHVLMWPVELGIFLQHLNQVSCRYA